MLLPDRCTSVHGQMQRAMYLLPCGVKHRAGQHQMLGLVVPQLAYLTCLVEGLYTTPALVAHSFLSFGGKKPKSWLSS